MTLGPLLWVILSSLQPIQNLLGSALNVFNLEDVSLDAYSRLVDRGFLQWLWNSTLVAFVVMAANVVFDSLAAYPLARMRFRGNAVAFTVVLAAIMVPAQVILLSLYVQFRDLQLLDTHWALILPYLVSPTGIFLMRQHFSTLPVEFEEAAAVDGAGVWRTYWLVIIPNSLAMLGTIALLKFIWTWGEFAWPSLAINSSELKTIPVGLAGLQGQFATDWPLLMAGSVLAVLPPIIMFLLLQRWFTEGLTAGAVKG
jgi:ABC-type glycerol-3-phosphate transport system permease component